MPDAIPLPDVYPVGVLRDLRGLRSTWKHASFGRFRRDVAYFLRKFPQRAQSPGYWNGFQADIAFAGQYGHGWTAARARMSLARIIATQHWASHKPCGTVHLVSEVARYCITCATKASSWQWQRIPAEKSDGRG